MISEKLNILLRIFIQSDAQIFYRIISQEK